MNLTRDECKAFRLNPGVNPRTNRRITVDGPVYKKLVKECGLSNSEKSVDTSRGRSKDRSKDMSRRKSKDMSRGRSPSDECKGFRLNPGVNPRTNRRITVDGPVYKKLVKKCGLSNNEKSKDTSRGRSKDRSKDTSRGRSKDESKDTSRGRSKDESKDTSRGRSTDRSKDTSRGRSKDESKDTSRGRSKDTPRDKSPSDECKAFRLNPGVNPRTNRRITVDGPVYKKLVKECGLERSRSRSSGRKSQSDRRRSSGRASTSQAFPDILDLEYIDNLPIEDVYTLLRLFDPSFPLDSNDRKNRYQLALFARRSRKLSKEDALLLDDSNFVGLYLLSNRELVNYGKEIFGPGVRSKSRMDLTLQILNNLQFQGLPFEITDEITKQMSPSDITRLANILPNTRIGNILQERGKSFEQLIKEKNYNELARRIGPGIDMERIQKIHDYNDILKLAAEAGNVELVKYALSKGANYYEGGLIGAAKGGYKDLVDFFVSKGAHAQMRMEKAADIGMAAAAEGGHMELVKFFISRGAHDWNWGMRNAAKGGHMDLVEFFISKGAKDWNLGMAAAAEGGHQELVDFFVLKGATNWNLGMAAAAEGGHVDLVEFFIDEGANNWNKGMASAASGGHRDLVDFFVSKGANLWTWAIRNASIGGHEKLENYLRRKQRKEERR